VEAPDQPSGRRAPDKISKPDPELLAEAWSSMPTGTDRLIKRAGIEGCHDPINRLKMKNISD
jgi:hypothetical protein